MLATKLNRKNSWGGNRMKGGGGGGGGEGGGGGGGGGGGDLFIEHNLVKVTYGAGVVN